MGGARAPLRDRLFLLLMLLDIIQHSGATFKPFKLLFQLKGFGSGGKGLGKE
jgi:hypothetical protein